MGGPRTDLAFPRAMEMELRLQGFDVESRVESVPGESIARARRRWPGQVLGFSPDVIVLCLGHYEAIHILLPRWFERHMNTQSAGTGRLESMYRQWVLRPTYRTLARTQAALDRAFGHALSKRRVKHAAAGVSAIVRGARQVGSPLVVLMEIAPLTERYERWFPAMNHRIDRINEGLRGIADADSSGEVCYFETRKIVAALGGPQDVTPDGFHFSPEAHGTIGRELAALVGSWAASQPHLARHSPS